MAVGVYTGQGIKVKTKVVESININTLYSTIVERVVQGVNLTARQAEEKAQIDVPVRKVFKYSRKNVGSKLFAEQRVMGRQEVRTLSLEEALGESVMRRRLGLPSAFPTDAGGRRQLGIQSTVRTAQFGAFGAPGSYRSKARSNPSEDFRTREVARISGVNRLVRREDIPGLPGAQHLVADTKAESELSGRGRAELRRADQTLGGALKKSIKLHTATMSRGGRIKARVSAGGGEVDYAKYVEYGTRRSRAQPFLRPALAQARVEFASNIRQTLKGGGSI